jgi:hypothetical protein
MRGDGMLVGFGRVLVRPAGVFVCLPVVSRLVMRSGFVVVLGGFLMMLCCFIVRFDCHGGSS